MTPGSHVGQKGREFEVNLIYKVKLRTARLVTHYKTKQNKTKQNKKNHKHTHTNTHTHTHTHTQTVLLLWKT